MSGRSDVLDYLDSNPDVLNQLEAGLPEAQRQVESLSPFSDDELTLAFTEKHSRDLRYTARMNAWFRFNGARWEEDKTLHIFDLARAVCREKAAECGKPNVAAKVSSAATIAAVERLARSDRCHATTVDQWDRDLWLLNTPDGTIELKTGKLRMHERNDLLTKIAAASPSGECPEWLRFLDVITNGDSELQLFLQRMVGYGLTGDTSEHALFFLYGSGANGKSTFVNCVSAMLGDYAVTAPMETFMATAGERHPTDLASLQGARIVVASEVEDGARWAESRLKSLTGGELISARRMRQDFFQFKPQFKLIVCGNHRPGLRGVDEAIRRRLHLIPFAVTIRPEDRDNRLGDKLREEWPGILQWAVDGCLEWQRIGLTPPETVRAATEAYLATEDALGRWIDESCKLGVGNFASTTALYESWKSWATRNGEEPGTQKHFVHALETRGIKKVRTMKSRGFDGIAIEPNRL